MYYKICASMMKSGHSLILHIYISRHAVQDGLKNCKILYKILYCSEKLDQLKNGYADTDGITILARTNEAAATYSLMTIVISTSELANMPSCMPS